MAPSATSGEYASALFGHFVAGVERLGTGAEILDLGPTVPDNLMFWAARGHRVAAIHIATKSGRSAGELGIRGRKFGGILCWNALAQLPRADSARLAVELRSLLLPGGMLFAIFDGDGRTTPGAVRYRISGEDRLRFEAAPSLPVGRPVATRGMEDLLAGLRTTRITVMRHGAREAVGRAPERVPVA